MIHEVVDLAHWKTLFPLAQSQAQGERFTGGETILGPRSLALFAQVRDEAAAVLAATEQLPTDIFI